jgi:cytochrome c biogenesis protein CcmG/thiol:disulfide interchange protein DsbE
MPETFIVDAKGTVVFKHIGPISPEALEQKVLPALQKARIAK